MNEPSGPGARARLWLWGVLILAAAGLVVYSQTDAFAWDEGFHLLAAQLIGSGKRPYLDFFFPQTPLNAYWNAFWMLLFGGTWRVAHAVAALAATGAALLTADFLLRRFPVPHWRLAAALAGLATFCLNVQVVEFGTLGQAYALCLLLSVAAFRAALPAVERPSPWLAGASGFLSAAAAGASLLTAPVAPVLALWIVVRNRAGNRWPKLAAFGAGGVLALSPLIVLFAESPRQVLFDVLKYHLLYRGLAWPNALPHDAGVVFSWLDSVQALGLGLLAIAGLIFIARDSGLDRHRRSEFYLCGWLALAISVYLCTAHPTFARYFVLTVPFLAILAAAGICSLADRMMNTTRPFWPVAIVLCIFAGGLSRRLIDDHDGWTWKDMERMAARVASVTPAGASIYADEHVYFLLRRTPPPGMESADSQKLTLPLSDASALHVIPKAEIERRLQSGEFHTVEMCSEDRIERLKIADRYPHSGEVQDCKVFSRR